MKLIRALRFVAILAGIGLVGVALPTRAADDAKDSSFTIGDGKFELPLPAGWLRKEPRVRIIEHEFEVPATGDDKLPCRVTVMGAGGSIEDNVNRWAGQFSQPDGSSTRDKLKTSHQTIADQDVTLVDISGTYEDKAGPFVPGPGVQRENYRMLAAIIATKNAGNYFIKFYGPSQTIAGQQANFTKMIEGLKAK